MADQKWYGISADNTFVFTAPMDSETNDLAEEFDAEYVTDAEGARIIRNSLDVLIGDRPQEMDNAHSIVDFLFNTFDQKTLADALAKHGYSSRIPRYTGV